MYDSHPERGLKRTCLSCEAKFYDMGRAPMVCPKCGTEFIEVIRPVSPSYSRKRGFFAKSRPEEAVEPGAEEPRSDDDEEKEGDEDGALELNGDGGDDEAPEEEAAEE